ncbi:MAG: large-conductance mechanosensitive channel [Bacteroidetes bacterium GWF2_38_335]|nr:MAG: large-conductance mechanosensitive channel [Bacteroidetes bacterium GWF2_38_335]OFY77526.1 MAG: large-conductance mechanosensitive channel [Bacteroidetes bacterium RIFOXYA12_FULL_38_20]HBS87177.1 large conductance mechanosensitive channel protein MscL [Bacteroidales bacterium]
MGFYKEFKEFAMKGNLIDMAVAFVMGAAFGKLVTAFIDGMIMPVVGQIISGVNFQDMKYVLSEATADKPEAAIQYGHFITVCIDFTLVAFVMFLVIKAINKMKRKQETAPAPPAEPSNQEKLLTEIRDLLKK